MSLIQQVRNASLTDLISTDLQRSYDPVLALARYQSILQSIPGKKAAIFLNSGNYVGAGFTALGAGMPTTNFTDLKSYASFDGTRAMYTAAATLAVPVNSAVGLTVALLAKFNNITGTQYLIEQDAATSLTALAFRIYLSGAAIVFDVSSSGTAVTSTITHSQTIVADTWYFIGARFTATSELELHVNNVVETTSTADTTFNAAATDVTVGGQRAATNYLNGDLSFILTCQTPATRAFLWALYESLRPVFNI